MTFTGTANVLGFPEYFYNTGNNTSQTDRHLITFDAIRLESQIQISNLIPYSIYCKFQCYAKYDLIRQNLRSTTFGMIKKLFYFKDISQSCFPFNSFKQRCCKP